jgi:excinuclease ABC subunit B
MIKPESLTPEERLKTIKNLQKEMKIAARDLNFEQAAIFRDKILELKKAELS